MRAMSTEPLQVFDVVFITRAVNLAPGAKRSVDRGAVVYQVFATDAEDAIRRLREHEPKQHPIDVIVSAAPAPPMQDGAARYADLTIFPEGITSSQPLGPRALN